MSRSDKDQAGGHPRRDKLRSGLLSCLCCNHQMPASMDPQRRIREASAWNFELMAEEGPNPVDGNRSHQFFAGRCLRCNIHYLDADLPGEQLCSGRHDDEPLHYSTSSDGRVTCSHSIPLD